MANSLLTWRSIPPRYRAASTFIFVLLFLYLSHTAFKGPTIKNGPATGINFRPNLKDGDSHWANLPERYPVDLVKALPPPHSQASSSIPKIQHEFGTETRAARKLRLWRRDLVKGNFTHAWTGYVKHAWLSDEVAPLTGQAHDHFGGWAATLVDSLDTLWIMGLHKDFEAAVGAISEINFEESSLIEVNIFETNIRYLGGFLGAYDISGGKYPALLIKAVEVGDMLYKAFDTPNRMPVTRWDFRKAQTGGKQVASKSTLLSEIGSLTLEFTRLSQATGDMKFYDAVQRIMDGFDNQQLETRIPGLWPVLVNAESQNFTSHGGFTIGAMADSLYEYLPKQHLLLGAATTQYQRLYERALPPMKRHIFYRAMTKDGSNIRFAGNVNADGKIAASELRTIPQAQHLGCFAGGMVAIGAKIFSAEQDLVLARQLTEGCLWAYENSPLGVMPEILYTVKCGNERECSWDEALWHAEVEKRVDGKEDLPTKIFKHGLKPGISNVEDPKYILRPEAIESVFILYRITGDESLLDRAWKMFESIIKHTKTDIAHAGLKDCMKTSPEQIDRMESFWLAETLKYFYLIFSEPELVSLDEFVLNTEAHPLRRPV